MQIKTLPSQSGTRAKHRYYSRGTTLVPAIGGHLDRVRP